MGSPKDVSAVVRLALEQDGVVCRDQARELGIDRWAVSHQVGAGRWKVYGDQAIAVHPMELTFRARCRVSVWQAGASAALDGASALAWAGLRNYDDGIHVIVPWPGKARRWHGSVVHPSRLWNEDDIVVSDGLPVVRPAVAAIRAGMWATSDRAGATVMAMAVQQRLAGPDAVLLEARRLNRHKRRPLLLATARDIAEGAQALSEIDFARLCRRRGLPTPTRQSVRRGRQGRVYLDVHWEDLGVVVEVEGAHHDAPENAVDDALRQNHLTLGQLDVLRIPVIGLRTCPDLFMTQVAALLEAARRRRAA